MPLGDVVTLADDCIQWIVAAFEVNEEGGMIGCEDASGFMNFLNNFCSLLKKEPGSSIDVMVVLRGFVAEAMEKREAAAGMLARDRKEQQQTLRLAAAKRKHGARNERVRAGAGSAPSGVDHLAQTVEDISESMANIGVSIQEQASGLSRCDTEMEGSQGKGHNRKTAPSCLSSPRDTSINRNGRTNAYVNSLVADKCSSAGKAGFNDRIDGSLWEDEEGYLEGSLARRSLDELGDDGMDSYDC